MQKLIHFALESAFPSSDLNGLMEVINSTENPDVATELVLGIYEYPELVSNLPENGANQVNLKMIKVDHIKQRVDYNYSRRETTYTIKNESGEVVEKTTSTYTKNRTLQENPSYSVEEKVTIKEDLFKDYMSLNRWVELQDGKKTKGPATI